VQIIKLNLDKSREAILKRKADGRWKQLEWMYASYKNKMDPAELSAYEALPSRADKLKKLRSLRDSPYLISDADYNELMKPFDMDLEAALVGKASEVSARARTRSRGRK